jgi:ethanolamine transporter EutH
MEQDEPLGLPNVILFKGMVQGSLGGAVVWRLPLAQGVILETRDRIPRRAPGAWSLLLSLPVSLPLSLSLCDYHK